MSKRIVIVGGVAAGASAAAKARRTSEDVEIVLLEAGPFVSFANCGLPYYVGGEIAQRDSLFVVSPQMLRRRFGIDVRLNTRAESIDRKARIVTIHTPDGGRQELGYDRLILATGTDPIEPPIPGLDRDDVFTVRTVPDVDAIMAQIQARLPAGQTIGEGTGVVPLHACVVGGGYIGLETAEQLRHRGLQVTLIEMADQVMPGALDPEMAAPLAKALTDSGADVILGDPLAALEERDGQAVAVTKSGKAVAYDLAIVGLGVRPSVTLARQAGLALGETGAIAVDDLQRTSEASIYAAGDNAEVRHLVLDRPAHVALAGPANKAGRAAGANAALDLAGAADDDPRRLRLRGVLGTAVVRVGTCVAGVTGLTERAARAAGLDPRVMYLPGPNHAGYYPGAESMLLKVLSSGETGRVLGAQAVGGAGVDKRLDVFATALTGGLTVEDVEQLDLCYAPPFGSAKDVAVLAGFAAANERRGISPTITPQQLLDELEGENPPVVLDVRTPKEFAEGHLDDVLHVPLDELRDRLSEVPTDRPLAVHCLGGYRSYCAQQILLNRGFQDVRNIVGGWGLIERVRALRAAGQQA